MRLLFIFHFGFSDQTKLEMLPLFFFFFKHRKDVFD